MALAFGYAELEIGLCIGRAGFLPDLVVKASSFLPESDGCFSFAEGGFEEGEAAQGVGQVERAGFGVAAVDAEGLFVVGQCCGGLASCAEDVGYVADGVSQVERVVEVALNGCSFLIEIESGGGVAEVAFDAAEALEGLGEDGWLAGLSGLGYGFHVDGFCVGEAMLAACLGALVQERFRG